MKPLEFVPIPVGFEDMDCVQDWLQECDDIFPLIRLLLWAATSKPDGILGKVRESQLERVMGVDSAFHALDNSGWITETTEGWQLVHWHLFAGRAMEEREKWAKRKKQQREDTSNVPGTGLGHAGDMVGDTSEPPEKYIRGGSEVLSTSEVKCSGSEVKQSEEKCSVSEVKYGVTGSLTHSHTTDSIFSDSLAHWRRVHPTARATAEQRGYLFARCDNVDYGRRLGTNIAAIDGNRADKYCQDKGLHSLRDIFREDRFYDRFVTAGLKLQAKKQAQAPPEDYPPVTDEQQADNLSKIGDIISNLTGGA